jgi:hypothetical protein
MSYQTEINAVARLVHQSLAKWLETDIAIIDAQQDKFVFYAPEYEAKITYYCGSETYQVSRANENGHAIGSNFAVVDGFMVMELFTRRRLIAALGVIK